MPKTTLIIELRKPRTKNEKADGCLGMYYDATNKPNEKRIWINSNQPNHEVPDTLMHELTHFVLDYINFDEPICEEMAQKVTKLLHEHFAHLKENKK